MDTRIKIIVSIDVECDKSKDWSIPNGDLNFKNIKFGLIDYLLPIVDKLGVKLTLLLSPEILDDEHSLELILNNSKNHELGTHLHIEFLETDKKTKVFETKKVQSGLTYLDELYFLTTLTDKFINKIGSKPFSFRSGRFGYSPNTLKLLSKLNYTHDSSVMPNKKLIFPEGEIDNNSTSSSPYLDKESGIIEVPVSHNPIFIVNKSRNYFLNRIDYKIRSKFNEKSFRNIWIRPRKHNINDIKNHISRILFQSHKNDIVFNLMFHSNELYPHTSPVCDTWADVRSFLLDFEQIIRFIYCYNDVESIQMKDFKINEN